MASFLNPSDLGRPTGPWSHGVLIDPGKRWLLTTGQVALAADGTVPADATAQAECIWARLRILLDEAGMETGDIVRTGVYATSVEALAAFNAVRNRVLGVHAPATTAVVVGALANPLYQLEVEVTACR